MKTNLLRTALAALCFAGLAVTTAHAGLITYTTDNFGSEGNAFSIQFAAIGNAGNGNDAGAGGGIYASPYGGVSYNFRIGVTEVPQDWITKATNLGMMNVTAGAFSGNQPAGNITWYEAAAFANWLNTSTGHQAAYNLNAGNTALTLWTPSDAGYDSMNPYRNSLAKYFLPSENEWYKAAYHKNDGVTANYWDYATGSNSIPDGIDFSADPAFDAVFRNPFIQGSPNVVTNVGLASPYGTMGQNGNTQEWLESAFDGSNNSSSENRSARGGAWSSAEDGFRSSAVGLGGPAAQVPDLGFRVASIEPIPEPATALTALLCLSAAALRRRRR